MRAEKTRKVVRAAITLLLGRASSRIGLLIGLMREAQIRDHDKAAAFCSRLLEKRGLYVSVKAKIGPGLKLPHPAAIIIGEGVVIGSSVTLYQSVTLGGRVIGDWKKGNYPEIGDGSVLFAGVVVAGKVRIGKNCIIGANSVVLTDIPDNSVAVGAPARVVKTLDGLNVRNSNDQSND